MRAFTYNKDLIYTGEVEVQESPLEPGKYLLPTNTTLIVPPTIDSNQSAKFIDGRWEIVDKMITGVFYDIRNGKKLTTISVKNEHLYTSAHVELLLGDEANFSNGSWVFTKKGSERKARELEEYKIKIEEQRKKVQYSPIAYMGYTFCTSKTANQNILGVLMTLKNDTDQHPWLDVDNNTVMMTKQQLTGLLTAIGKRASEAYQKAALDILEYQKAQ